MPRAKATNPNPKPRPPRLNSRDVFTLAEAVASNETGQRDYIPRDGCLTAARRLVKLGLLVEHPNSAIETFLPTEQGAKAVGFLAHVLAFPR